MGTPSLRLPKARRTLTATVVFGVALAGLQVTSASSQPPVHAHQPLEVADAVLSWGPADQSASRTDPDVVYWVFDEVSGSALETRDTSVDLPQLDVGEIVNVTVMRVRQGQVEAISRLRGGAEGFASQPEQAVPVSVQEGMNLLAAMRVESTPASVSLTLPAALTGVVDEWSVYRSDGQEIATEPASVTTIVDDTVSPGTIYGYTVQLHAPDWVSDYDTSLPWVDTPSDGCEAEGQRVDCADVMPKGPAVGVESDWETVSGDGLTFTVPIETPSLETISDFEANQQVAIAASRGDAHVRFRTFIPTEYVNPPEPYFWSTDYWFGGDHRGFSNSLSASYRTYVRTRMDWPSDTPYVTRGVYPTHRYIHLGGGQLCCEATRAGTNDATHQHIRHSGSRYRFRVRHTAGNPFESYYPPIDYEWEYVMSSDGGVTARGLHDGAPNHEILYERPYSSTQVAVYRHTVTGYGSLWAPMDQKDKSWCASGTYGCPWFGDPVWV